MGMVAHRNHKTDKVQFRGDEVFCWSAGRTALFAERNAPPERCTYTGRAALSALKEENGRSSLWPATGSRHARGLRCSGGFAGAPAGGCRQPLAAVCWSLSGSAPVTAAGYPVPSNVTGVVH